MKYRYDLQLHSTLSDGDWPVAKVISLAKKNNLKAISITDHDVGFNFGYKNRLAKRAGIEHIPSLEISCRMFGTEVHVLGYAKKFDEQMLTTGLQTTIRGYNRRVQQMIAKLNRAKVVNLSWQQLKKRKAKGVAVRKYDLARAMAPLLGITSKEANKYVNAGGVGYVPYGNWAMLPTEAIQLIHRAGGIAVLSHPGETRGKLIKKYGNRVGEQKFNRLLTALLKSGLDGLEIYSPKNDPAIRKRCLKLAQAKQLLITGGSDWHGEKHHPELRMGDGGLTRDNFQRFLRAIKKASVSQP